MNNLKQLSTLFSMYLMDYEGIYPPWRYNNNDYTPWHRTAMGKYINNGKEWVHKQYKILACPSARESVAPGYFRVSYAYNRGGGDGIAWNAGDTSPVKESQVKSPSTTILLTERNQNPYGSAVVYNTIIDNTSQVSFSRHQVGANFLFCDGHGEFLSPGQVRNGLFTKNPND
jgi:prepilin-type processing-associated H-X9-DG protein